MDPGDALATIAESQLGTRSDLWSDQGSLFGYLLATNAHLAAFGSAGKKKKRRDLHWVREGFGERAALHVPHSLTLLPELHQEHSPYLLRIHNWCAAFVDWCVLQLLLRHGHTTFLSLAARPRTAAAFGLLAWGRRQHCLVFEGHHLSPQRGDIAVFRFSHVGIVSSPLTKSREFMSVEGNTTRFGHGNQGYVVERRSRSASQLRGLVRIPEYRQRVLDPAVRGKTEIA